VSTPFSRGPLSPFSYKNNSEIVTKAIALNNGRAQWHTYSGKARI
jgi:hypothetical protein